MIYLDNSATTRIDPKVKKAMLPYLNEQYGNPAVAKYYTLAEHSQQAVNQARTNLAKLINCDTDELIFTSGATESNNFILKGIANYYSDKGNHIITSKMEHKSVLKTCQFLEKQGYKITYLDINKKGKINPEKIKDSITENTILISIMWGNNEIGTMNNISEIANIAKDKDILFHTDATQVLGKVNIDAKKVPFDFLSCSAHKIYGPKGVGAAYIKKDDLGFKKEITPLLHGGKQENGLRGGTLSVHNIVGFGKAAEIAYNKKNEYMKKIKNLEKDLKNKLKNNFSNIKFNGDQKQKIPGIINITIPGINNEFFISDIRDKIAISTGSACSINEPSHTLKSLGLKKSEIISSIRISLGKFNTKKDIEDFIDILDNYLS